MIEQFYIEETPYIVNQEELLSRKSDVDKAFGESINKLQQAYDSFLREAYKHIDKIRKNGTKKQKLRYLFPRKISKKFEIPKIEIKTDMDRVSCSYITVLNLTTVMNKHTHKELYHKVSKVINK